MQLREQHLYYQDQLLPISRIIPHPNYYSVENGADIALLELDEPVSISCHVQPVTLPPKSETFPPGTQCWVTGWGNVDNRSECRGPQDGAGPGSRLWCFSGDQGPHSLLPPDAASLCPLPPGRLPPPFPLKQVKVPVVENSVCDRKYHSGLSTGDNVPIVREDMLCAGDSGRDSCQVGQRPPPAPTARFCSRTDSPNPPRRATLEGLWSAR